MHDLIVPTATEIVTAHVQPGGEKLWARVVRAVDKLGATNLAHPESLIVADDDVRRAWIDLSGLAGTYTELRNAYTVVVPHTGETWYDVRGCHSELIAGYCAVVDYARALSAEPVRWPRPENDTRARLVYFAKHNLTPHFPTRAERDAAYMAVEKHAKQAHEFEEQQRRGRFVASSGYEYD